MCVCEFTSVHVCVCICMREYACTYKKSSSWWALCLQMTLPTTSSQYFYSEDSGPLGCQTALLGEWFLTFSITVLWKNGKHSSNTGSHARRLEWILINTTTTPTPNFYIFSDTPSNCSIFSPTFQKYLNLILQEFFRNDVKSKYAVYMWQNSCWYRLLQLEFCYDTNFYFNTYARKPPKFQHSLLANNFNGC